MICNAAKTKGKVGFRWDGANLRWVRDDRFAELAQDRDAVTIKSLTGIDYLAWPVIHTELNDAGLKGVSPEEASKLIQKGWTMVDVRLAVDFEREHPEGALSIPLFRPVEGRGPFDNLKRLAMASFAMQATERDPDFMKKALKKLKKNQKIIVACAIGGTLDTLVTYRREKKLYNDPERAFGRESRSLKAAHEFYQNGWSVGNMVYLDGGVQQWRYQGYPIAGTRVK